MKAKSQRPKLKKSKARSRGPNKTAKWPVERQYMERPERFKYVRKMLPDEGCVFCNAAKAGVGFSNLVLFENDLLLVVQNKFPYNTGHLLVLPKRHVADLSEVTDQEVEAIGRMTKISVGILRKVYQCDGLNVGLNLGAAAGAGIPGHLHWHIVPRWNGDTNFFPLIAGTKVLPETLQQTYDKLFPLFKVIK